MWKSLGLHAMVMRIAQLDVALVLMVCYSQNSASLEAIAQTRERVQFAISTWNATLKCAAMGFVRLNVSLL